MMAAYRWLEPTLSIEVYEALQRYTPYELGYQACLALGAKREEVFAALFLDRKLRVLAAGTFTEHLYDSVAPPLEDILRRGEELDAIFVAIAHNHPSGDPTPSRSDQTFTHQLAARLEQHGMMLLDHFVVAAARWTSMRVLGLLD